MKSYIKTIALIALCTVVVGGYFIICAFSFKPDQVQEIAAIDIRMACLVAALAVVVGVAIFIKRNFLHKKFHSL